MRQLVDEIIELLSSKEPSLENALFKAKVLAHRAGSAELAAWVDAELGGYPGTSEVPAYRTVDMTVMGNVSNMAVRHNDFPIPLAGLPEPLKTRLQVSHLRQSIAAVEVISKKEDDLAVVIAPELYPSMSKHLANGFRIEKAWGKHSAGAMRQVVVEVRSRLLDFVLKLSDNLPKDEGDNVKDMSEKAGLNDLFRHAVFGDNATVIVGGGHIGSIRNDVRKADRESLAAALRKVAVPDPDIEALQQAIDADAETEEVKSGSPGPKVKSWIGSMVAKAGGAGWAVSLEAAGNLLAAAIMKFYGGA